MVLAEDRCGLYDRCIMYLAIDIGGTKTLLARMGHDGKVQESFKFPTPHEYEEFKQQLADNIAKITTDKWQMVCVAAPGRIDRERGVGVAFGNLDWQNVPLRDDIKKLTRCDVLLENDVKLAGLSEARFLRPKMRKVVYITISTGISNGVIIDQTIDPDLQDSEAGHMLFERGGKLVTWESFASGKAIVKRFGKIAAEIDDPKIWEIISHDFALGIIDIIANIQPDIIIIGGGVGSHFHKYEKPLQKALKKYESPMVPIPPVVAAKHPEEAVIYGCYELIKDHASAA